MKIVTAKQCAWRAIYVYSGSGSVGSPVRFAIGIDPQGSRATLFGSIGFRRDCTGGRKGSWHWRFQLPRCRHWWRLDGRRRFEVPVATSRSR